ncbi:MAG: hypothetical protein RMK97_09430 [Sutterellaceae bacterium]|nr:hypothetical protein [Burkholderiaceae bacterium]MCX7901615.1 hypothetical protein [Burkholderiaceae bacterium]MDW8430703.1 hypothetical protein [Sutterellaceae bacterium]
MSSLALLRRLLEDRRYEKLVLVGLAAVFQRNRTLAVQRELLHRTDWVTRLLHGSEFPRCLVCRLSMPWTASSTSVG